MPKERTPEEVYADLSSQGLYEEAGSDKDELIKIVTLTIQDYEFGKKLLKIKDPNWRVIFNINYDVLRELCDVLLRFKKQKCSNHQGVFAFIILEFSELELDWPFFETIRMIRNNNKYRGIDITKDTWNKIELQLVLYIDTIHKEIKNLF